MLPAIILLSSVSLFSLTFLIAPRHGPGPPSRRVIVGGGVVVTAVSFVQFVSQLSPITSAKPKRKRAPMAAWSNGTRLESSTVDMPFLAGPFPKPPEDYITQEVWSLVVRPPSLVPGLTHFPFWAKPGPPATPLPVVSLDVYRPPQPPVLNYSPFWACPDLDESPPFIFTIFTTFTRTLPLPLPSRISSASGGLQEEKEVMALDGRLFLSTMCTFGDRPVMPACTAATNSTIEVFQALPFTHLDVLAWVTEASAGLLAFYPLPAFPILPAFPNIPPFPALPAFGTHLVHPAFAPAIKGNATTIKIPALFIGPIDIRPIPRRPPPVKEESPVVKGRFLLRLLGLGVLLVGWLWSKGQLPEMQMAPVVLPGNESLPVPQAEAIPQMTVGLDREVEGEGEEPHIPEDLPPRVFPRHMGRAKLVAGRRFNPRTPPRTPLRSASRLAEMKTEPSTIQGGLECYDI